MFKAIVSRLFQPNPVFLTAVREKNRPATRLKLRLMRQKRLAKLAAMGVVYGKKLNFKERMAQNKLKNIVTKAADSLSTEWPSRLLKQPHLLTAPPDDVVRLSSYDRMFSVEESLQMHRELNHPTMYNNVAAPLILRLDLNMNLDLTGDEFVENVSTIVSLPHRFGLTTKRTLGVFTKTIENQQLAHKAGAEYSYGADSVKKIVKGHIRLDEIDYFLATVDVIAEIMPIRGLIKDKFPSALNGGLGFDVTDLVEHFRHGVGLEMKRDDARPDWGVCSTVIGRLNMPDEHVIANVGGFIKAVCQRRPLAASLGHFIYRACLIVQDSKEFHQIDFTEFAPPIPVDDSGLAEVEAEDKTKKKKKKKSALKAGL